jgi:Ca2+-binding EF-hand superfamily protein
MLARQLVFAGVLFGTVATTAGVAGAQQSQARQDDLRENQAQLREMDRDNDGVITRAEWHGTVQSFRRYDTNRDGVLSGTEIWTDARRGWSRERFARLDENNDGAISRGEWRAERAEFDRLDRDRDGYIERDELPAFNDREFEEPSADRELTGSPAYRAGRDRGLADGRQAGREDKTINGGRWDLDGQRELETADAGYNESVGPRAQYQAGYRVGFKLGYREGFGPR